MGSVRIAVQNIIDLTDDLDLSRSQYVKTNFGPYLGSSWTNCHQILTLGSFGPGLSMNQKNLERLNVRRMRTSYVGLHHAKKTS